MNAAKTTAERVQEVRARRKAAGLVRLELWLHPDDAAAVRDLAAKLTRRRERRTTKEGNEPPASG